MRNISYSFGVHNNKDVIWVRFNYDPDLNKEMTAVLLRLLSIIVELPLPKIFQAFARRAIESKRFISSKSQCNGHCLYLQKILQADIWGKSRSIMKGLAQICMKSINFDQIFYQKVR